MVGCRKAVSMFRKVYIDVILKTDKEGVIRPLTIVWEDGKTFEIDRVKAICKAASLKVGGCGTRYTVVIEGKETYLFHEDERWFVEAKQ